MKNLLLQRTRKKKTNNETLIQFIKRQHRQILDESEQLDLDMNRIVYLLYFQVIIGGVVLLLLLNNGLRANGSLAVICFILAQVVPFFIIFRNNLFKFFTPIKKNHWSVIFVIVPGLEFLITVFLARIIVGNSNYELATNSTNVAAMNFLDHLLYIGQIFAENLLYIGAFLAIYLSLNRFTNMRLITSVIISVLSSALFFGMLHYSTYDQKLLQVLLFIGLTSSVQVLLYIRTRNILASFFAHLTYNYLLFFIVIYAKYTQEIIPI